MKIALMTNNYKPFVAGVPISIERLAEGLKQLGHEVIVFAPTYKNMTKEKGIIRYHSLLKGIYGGFSIPFPLDFRIKEAFEREKFDIIHVHHPMLIGKVAIYLSHKYHIPLVFTYHTRYEQYVHYGLPNKMLTYQPFFNATQKVVEKYLQQFFLHCDHIFVPTKGMQSYLTHNCSYESENISVLPTGISKDNFTVDIQKRNQIRREYCPENGSLFLSVSRIAKEKNMVFLLQCMKEYKNNTKKPFKVLLIGDGPDCEYLKNQTKDMGIEENIIFMGKIPNCALKDYYAASDAFVFASKSETQGIVLLEAFAVGTPVIGVNATGVSDLIKDGINGYLVEENTEEFSKKMLRLESDMETTEYMKQNAIRTAYGFEESTVAKEAIKQYNEIMLEHKSKWNQNSRGVEKWKATSIVS